MSLKTTWLCMLCILLSGCSNSSVNPDTPQSSSMATSALPSVKSPPPNLPNEYCPTVKSGTNPCSITVKLNNAPTTASWTLRTPDSVYTPFTTQSQTAIIPEDGVTLVLPDKTPGYLVNETIFAVAGKDNPNPQVTVQYSQPCTNKDDSPCFIYFDQVGIGESVTTVPLKIVEVINGVEEAEPLFNGNVKAGSKVPIPRAGATYRMKLQPSGNYLPLHPERDAEFYWQEAMRQTFQLFYYSPN